MKFEEAKLHYEHKQLKKELGRCLNCSHIKKTRYCTVRERYIDYRWIDEKIMVIFCKYYEPIEGGN